MSHALRLNNASMKCWTADRRLNVKACSILSCLYMVFIGLQNQALKGTGIAN